MGKLAVQQLLFGQKLIGQIRIDDIPASQRLPAEEDWPTINDSNKQKKKACPKDISPLLLSRFQNDAVAEGPDLLGFTYRAAHFFDISSSRFELRDVAIR